MRTRCHFITFALATAAAFSLCLARTWGAWPEFRHHAVPNSLPIESNGTGDYGLPALVDLDGDGDLDFVLGGRAPLPRRLYWFEFQGPDRWVQHLVGTNYLSDVGLTPLDVDGDGHPDLVCSGVWYRNPGKPASQSFERIVFSANSAGAHDVLAVDMNHDGHQDVVLLGDQNTELKGIYWFEIPADPRQPWPRHFIGPAIHGAVMPGGVTDLDGDSDPDVLRGDTWFENKDGKGLEWVAHRNIPFGRVGPYGMCVRTAAADLDDDGKVEIIMGDADIVDSHVVILHNVDGKGGAWSKEELPRSFTYGSLHSLAVVDLNNDGKPDIVVNEQEELLPPDRENPRWVAWENLGSGKFAERILLDRKLGGHELQAGDIDGDGDIDLCSKPWGVLPWNGAGGKMHVDFLENRLK